VRIPPPAVALLAVLVSGRALAADWPPADANEYSTEVDFSLAFAKRLRGFKSLADLQRAAKAKGRVEERTLEGDEPRVVFHWRSEPPNSPGVGYLLAIVRPDGKITANILTTDKHMVVVSNTGVFSVERAH
jgi:hypothetical protein